MKGKSLIINPNKSNGCVLAVTIEKPEDTFFLSVCRPTDCGTIFSNDGQQGVTTSRRNQLIALRHPVRDTLGGQQTSPGTCVEIQKLRISHYEVVRCRI